MTLKILYKKIATKFISKNKISKDEVDSLVVKSMKKIIKKEDINIDLKKLVTNEQEFFRIRKGNIRIIFSFDLDGNVVVCLVENIGYRGDIYKWKK